MSTADEIYSQRQAERKAAREKRAEIDKQLHDAFCAGHPRAHRATRFAHQVLHLMRKYVPDACLRDAEVELTVEAFERDLEIAQVPPERDAESATALNVAKFAMMPPTIVSKTSGE